MFEFNSLIGLTEKEAKIILTKNGFNKTKTIINSTGSENCDIMIVCAVRYIAGIVTLICGEFLGLIKDSNEE